MGSEDTPTLLGERVTLRATIERDADDMAALGRDPEIARFYGSIDPRTELTREDAARFLSDIGSQPRSWIIEVEGICAGLVRLNDLRTGDERASLAIGFFHRRFLGRGLGSEAIILLAHHAFTDLGLHRLGLRVLAGNARAIRAYEKCGFRIEGREREAALVGEVREDDLIMGLLKREFMASDSADDRSKASFESPRSARPERLSDHA